MREVTQQRLSYLFVIGALILVGLVLWNIIRLSDSGAAKFRTAQYKFRYTVPATILRLGDNLYYNRMDSPVNGVPRQIFHYQGELAVPRFTSAMEKVFSGTYSVHLIGDKPDVRKFELRTDEQPVGQIILQRKVMDIRGVAGIIIDDFGYARDAVVEGFLHLPPKLTYSVIPGHRYSQSFAREAVRQGFEVIIHMPMEATEDPGGEETYVLRPQMSGPEVRRRLQGAAGELPMAVGLNNHQGSLATQDSVLMEQVAGFLADNRMYFVDSYTTPKTVGYWISGELGIPRGRRSVFLDNRDDPEYIRDQLAQLVEKAKEYGSAIGIGHSKAATLAVLQEEIPRYEANGIRFARISEIIEETKPVLLGLE